ncbi:TetR/AcrR family transcriptional regulator [Fictibacillus terranigra]|uniref:Helix-turn-helix domain-containing protein n=1 Tax=Fictibacillus terranigra TaxID=3058424 RepID=A0ABT8E4U4_9BACL|nr:helix-turn-helix domain-containing protein [Fictibacillus sp. CENA-BCM004]MDN4072920.1 helix-turn-helix domain-containing protein [Fictibacillus sp. CENA-BCM004]
MNELGEIRNAERTRKSILEAAREEFFEKGYSGARIESIAKRAGVNKQLIYHYFKGKDQLINETIDDVLTSLPAGNLVLPANPTQIAEFRFNVNQKYLMDFLKFTAWEAIDKGSNNLKGIQHREKILHSYNEDMKAKQEMGLVPKELDPTMITLMMSSITIYPLLYPDVTRMITGLDPEDTEFKEKWTHYLHQISERIFRK